jgi:peptide chain release factor
MYLLISTGRGPAECQQAVVFIYREILSEAETYNIEINPLEEISSKNGLLSVLLHINGSQAEQFCKVWEGTIQWICRSDLRPNHGRKNWFVGITAIPEMIEIDVFSTRDLRIETMTAGGKGGQHVNKTESAVRITHIPTGISVIARDERSQHRNRAIAIARLHKLLFERERKQKQIFIKENWSEHNSLERGNPTRVYEGKKFIRVK